MKTYFIQFRSKPGARLEDAGKWRGRSAAGAIAQAARMIASWGCDVCEVVATPQDDAA